VPYGANSQEEVAEEEEEEVAEEEEEDHQPHLTSMPHNNQLNKPRM